MVTLINTIKMDQGYVMSYGVNILYSPVGFEGIALMLPLWFIPRSCRDYCSMQIGDGVFTIGIQYLRVPRPRRHYVDLNKNSKFSFKFKAWQEFTNYQVTTFGRRPYTFREIKW